MKVISLYPLWAVLLVHALKKNETRSWEMKHRGLLLIHATQKVTPLEKELCQQEPYRSALASIGISSWKELPTGGIIGQVEVVDCGQVKKSGMQEFIQSPKQHWGLPWGDEKHFGDYSLDRWITFCQNHTAFKKLIPFKGNQGFAHISLEDFNRLSI
jgi:activating signal cointegrator 1